MKYLFYAIVFDVAGNTTAVGSLTTPAKTITTNIQKVTGISINPSSAQTKNIGENFTITATVSPSDANNKGINWSSSSTSVATVDSNGNVRCLAAGTTTITATAADGSSVQASIELTVKVPLTDIILDKSTVGLGINGSTTITATTTPSDASANLLKWTTSDSSVAEISVSGKTITIIGKKAGTATIFVTGGSITRTATISVVSADITTINASKNFDYTGSVQELKVSPGQKYKLEVWGAQGGNATGTSSINDSNFRGGYGGYSTGYYIIPDNITKLYVYVGGQGQSSNTGGNSAYGGWNGGGGVNATTMSGSTTHAFSSGGGGTDICTVKSDVSLDSYYRYIRTTASYNSRIIVAGGGGGNGIYTHNVGGNGGGYIGGTGNSSDSGECGTGGTQTAAGSSTDDGCSTALLHGNTGGKGFGATGWWQRLAMCVSPGGGGGYYGGGTRLDCNNGAIGAGGSGYIGGVTGTAGTEKFMVTYNGNNYNTTLTSTSASTYTKVTTNVSQTATSSYVKKGNGYAKVTLLSN